MLRSSNSRAARALRGLRRYGSQVPSSLGSAFAVESGVGVERSYLSAGRLEKVRTQPSCSAVADPSYTCCTRIHELITPQTVLEPCLCYILLRVLSGC